MKIEKILFWILNLLSLFLIVQIGLGIIPRFNCDFSDSFVSGLNQTLLNLSYSYVAGVIMYLLISYIPDLGKNKRITATVKPDLELLLNEMYIFLFYLNNKYIKSKDFNNLKLSDFKKIDNFSLDKMDFRFSYTKTPNITHSLAYDMEIDYFITRRDAIISLIDGIFIIPSAVYLDDNLIIHLRNLRNCSLFKFAEYKHSIDVENFDNQLFQFYNLYKLIQDNTKINVNTIKE
jgi:hypothetical protein